MENLAKSFLTPSYATCWLYGHWYLIFQYKIPYKLKIIALTYLLLFGLYIFTLVSPLAFIFSFLTPLNGKYFFSDPHKFPRPTPDFINERFLRSYGHAHRFYPWSFVFLSPTKTNFVLFSLLRLLDTFVSTSNQDGYIEVDQISAKYEESFPDKENRHIFSELGKLAKRVFPGVQKKGWPYKSRQKENVNGSTQGSNSRLSTHLINIQTNIIVFKIIM